MKSSLSPYTALTGKMTIRWKMILLFMLITFAAMLVILPIQQHGQIKQLEEVYREASEKEKIARIEQFHNLAQNLKTELENDIAAMNSYGIVTTINNCVDNNEFAKFAILLNKNGDTTHRTGDQTLQSRQVPPLENGTPAGLRIMQSYEETSLKGEPLYHIIIPLFESPQKIWGALHVTFSLQSIVQKAAKQQVISRKAVMDQTRQTMLYFFGFIILVFFITLFASSKLSKPLEELASAIQDFDISSDEAINLPPVSSRDEIGVLHAAFVSLTDRLRQSYQQIESYSRELEQKVKERTRAIDAQNQMLQDALKDKNHEIDERKKVEQILRQNEIELTAAKDEAERANQAKSRFLATVSHEIRTPVNGITGSVSLLHNSPLSYRQRHLCDNIDSSAKVLLFTINDLLDYAKIEAGKLQLEELTFNLPKLLDETLAMIGIQAYRKGLKIAANFPEDIPLFIKSDRLRLQQMITNLLSNAVKFTEKGFVMLSVETVKKPDGAWLNIAVQDSGRGIKKEEKSLLFTPFSQANTSVARRFGGTGLGLAISRSLAELMGGTISLNSTFKQGSTFTIEIPIHNDDAPSASNEIPQIDSLPVYLNIQDPMNLQTVKSYLRLLKVTCLEQPTENQPYISICDFTEAANPHEELEIYRQYHQGPTIGLVTLSQNAEYQQDRCAFLLMPINLMQMHQYLSFCNGQSELTPVDGLISTKNRSTLKILLAEDHPVNQDIFLHTLEQLGYKADLAEDGKMAVAMATKKQYDLIFMDCEMPEMDGYQATAAIRQQETSQNLLHKPIIAVSAYDMPEERRRMQECGMDQFLPKPIKLEELSNLLNQYAKENDLKIFIDEMTQHISGITRNMAIKYLKLFVKSNAPEIERLDQLLDKQDEELAVALHRISGSAASLGLKILARDCKQAEQEIKSQNWQNIPDSCQSITAAFYQIQACCPTEGVNS